MHHVNDDGCLAMGEGNAENISEFQVGIGPSTTVKPVKGSNHWATGTPGEGGLLPGFFFRQSVLIVLEGSRMWPSINVIIMWKMEWCWIHLWMNEWCKSNYGCLVICGDSYLEMFSWILISLHPLPSNHHMHHLSTGAFNAISSFIKDGVSLINVKMCPLPFFFGNFLCTGEV